jgi:aryl-alcohol dehydrogenase-like predicted oxidoreductase
VKEDLLVEYRNIGKSDLKVSEVSIGALTFGGNIDDKATARIIDYGMELGINYIDTADAYGGMESESEKNIGKAIKGKRSQLIIATKFGVNITKEGRFGFSKDGLGSRAYIMKAVNDSLTRLDTDYIDLYQYHMPDSSTPIEETLRALDELVRAGKVRYIGCSNMASWELCESLWVSRLAGLNSFISVQQNYSLLNRNAEEQLAQCCVAYNVSLIPYFPLASGFLTGKYRRGVAPPLDSRFGRMPAGAGMLSDANYDQLEKLEEFAKQRGHTILELAIGWLVSHPWIPTVIAGVSKPEQVKSNVAAAEWKLTAEEMAELDKVINYQPYSIHPSRTPRKYVMPDGYLFKS